LEGDISGVALEGMRANGGGMAGEEGFGMGPTGQSWERTAWAEDWTLERKEGKSNWRGFDGVFLSWLVGFWEPKGKKGIFVIVALQEGNGNSERSQPHRWQQISRQFCLNTPRNVGIK
jgi:hypothetical protein